MTTRHPSPCGARVAAAIAAAVVLAGCAGTLGGAARERPPPAPPAASASAEAARQYLDALAELLEAAPARQAELLNGARTDAENAATTMHKLRYAILLAAPGHGGADPVAARRQLSELLARPELLLPAERALATVFLKEVDERLVLIAENRRLQQESVSVTKDRNNAQARRLQSEIDENARLRRALDEAQKKLDAVTQLERSIVERGEKPGKP
jgi:hypothetical protein